EILRSQILMEELVVVQIAAAEDAEIPPGCGRRNRRERECGVSKPPTLTDVRRAPPLPKQYKNAGACENGFQGHRVVRGEWKQRETHRLKRMTFARGRVNAKNEERPSGGGLPIGGLGGLKSSP